MPLYLGPCLRDDVDQRGKGISLFAYPSTTVDLVDGNLVSAVLATTTYGAGKSVEKFAFATSYFPASVGFVDHAVDASQYKYDQVGIPRLIKVVTTGVKVDVVTDGSTTVGSYQVPAPATDGACTDGATTTDPGYAIGVAMDGDGVGTSADVLVFPRWYV